jgi:hypothetical protein
MKWTTIIILLFGLVACNNRTDKNVVDEKAKTVHVDSSYIDSNEINDVGGQPYKEFHNCNFDEFIADKKTPKLAKDIYLDNDWNLRNDNEALALLDSLTAKNKQSRPFYFKVVTKTYLKSDGYFSEGLGLAGKEYVENNTKEFITYFDNKDCFTDNDLTTWAKIVILEFSISGEGEYDKPIIDAYIKKLKSNSNDCSSTQKENINKFGLTLKREWKEFLKNID